MNGLCERIVHEVFTYITAHLYRGNFLMGLGIYQI